MPTIAVVDVIMASVGSRVQIPSLSPMPERSGDLMMMLWRHHGVELAT